MTPLNLKDLQLWIAMGRLQLEEGRPINMRDMMRSGLVSRIPHGVKLLAKVSGWGVCCCSRDF